MTPRDGGPAFPSGALPHGSVLTPYDGMSLRDYFAGQALAGHIASSRIYSEAAELANDAYEIADAMLKAREEV